MTRVVQSFSVPDGSVAHAKLRQWKEEGGNISAIIQMLIEEENVIHQIEAMKRKIRYVSELTRDGKMMSKDDWEETFWGF